MNFKFLQSVGYIIGFTIMFFGLRNFHSLPANGQIACYSCTSTDSSNCRKVERIKKCSYPNDMCITLLTEDMKYISSNEAIRVTEFQKLCGSTKLGCQSYCSSLLHLGIKSCKSSCCGTPLCNKYRPPRGSNSPSIRQDNDWYLMLIMMFHGLLIIMIDLHV